MPCATALDPLWLSLCGSTGATKRSVCIGFGGGALLNICGLFAGMMYRGIRVVYVPTTFLAMHDVVRPPQTACAISLFVGRSDDWSSCLKLTVQHSVQHANRGNRSRH